MKVRDIMLKINEFLCLNPIFELKWVCCGLCGMVLGSDREKELDKNTFLKCTCGILIFCLE